MLPMQRLLHPNALQCLRPTRRALLKPLTLRRSLGQPRPTLLR